MRSCAAALAAAAVGLALVLAPTAGASSSLRVGIFDDGVVALRRARHRLPPAREDRHEAAARQPLVGGPGPPCRDEQAAATRPTRTIRAYNWDTYDRTVRFAIVNGIEPVFSIVGTPPWANAAKGWNVAPTNARRPPPVRGRGAEALQRHVRQRRRRRPPAREALDGVERAEQPGLPEAAVPRAPGRRGRSRAAATTRRSATRSSRASSRCSTSSKVACGATGPRGNNNPNSSRPSVSPLPFLRAMKAGGAKGFDAYAHHPVLRLARRDADDEAAARAYAASRRPRSRSATSSCSSRSSTSSTASGCGSGSPSTATRPSRPTRSSASRTRSRRATSRRRSRSPAGTRGSTCSSGSSSGTRIGSAAGSRG